MAGGQQINAGQGTILGGPGQVLSGAEAASAAGTGVAAALVRLNSRKVGGGTATFALGGQASAMGQGLMLGGPGDLLIGQATTSGAGSVAPARSRLLTGSAITGQAGSVISNGTDADWIARAAEADIIADRLNTTTKLVAQGNVDATHWLLADGKQGQVVLDSTIFPTGSSGSWKFSVLNTDGANSGNVGIYYGDQRTFTKGDTFWYGFNFYEPPEHAYQPWAGSDGEGPKRAIHSHSSSSNQPFELVFQVMNAVGAFTGYHQDGVNTAIAEWVAYSSLNNPGADFRRSPSIDRGANRLTGNNPDTGAAWTAEQQERARYGFLQSSQSQPQFKRGLGDPFTGDFRNYPNEWVETISRGIVGDSGVANSRWTVWIKRQNGTPLLLWDDTACKLGGVPQAQFNTLWLLPYVTNRAAGGRKITSRTNNLPWLNIYTFGNSTPIGTGTLTYNPANQRLTWAGQGEFAGTAVGFSLANGISTRNVISGSNTDSFAVVEATSTPPSSGGVVTEQVSIADGRKDTQYNVADVRVSTRMLKFKGGFAPPGISTLELLAASMAPGTWAQLTPSNNQNTITGTAPGNSGSRLHYMNSASWNPIQRRVEIVGADHGETNVDMPVMAYSVDTNAFSFVWGNDAGQGTGVGHGFDHNAINPATGWAYQAQYGSHLIVKNRQGSASEAFSVSKDSGFLFGNITWGTAWWSGSLSGTGAQGALICYTGTGTGSGSSSDGVIYLYDPLANSWTFLTGIAPFSGTTGSTYHQVCEYSALKNCAVYGGGNATDGLATKLWRLNSDRTFTAMPALPAGLNVGILRGNLCCDPSTGNFLLLSNPTNSQVSQLWELNPSGSGSWTQLSGTVPSAFHVAPVSGLDQSGSVSAAVPLGAGQNVVFYCSQTNASDGQTWLYKRSNG